MRVPVNVEYYYRRTLDHYRGSILRVVSEVVSWHAKNVQLSLLKCIVENCASGCNPTKSRIYSMNGLIFLNYSQMLALVQA